MFPAGLSACASVVHIDIYGGRFHTAKFLRKYIAACGDLHCTLLCKECTLLPY